MKKHCVTNTLGLGNRSLEDFYAIKEKHIALSVAICVGATGCKSEEVKNTEKLIKEIDSTITL